MDHPEQCKKFEKPSLIKVKPWELSLWTHENVRKTPNPIQWPFSQTHGLSKQYGSIYCASEIQSIMIWTFSDIQSFQQWRTTGLQLFRTTQIPRMLRSTRSMQSKIPCTYAELTSHPSDKEKVKTHQQEAQLRWISVQSRHSAYYCSARHNSVNP